VTRHELETAYEELQSSNEELETTNEELQSTNEELRAINDELRERTAQLNTTNSFLSSVLSSLNEGVAVVDRSLAIVNWSAMAEEMWGLREEEVEGQLLLGLDIGLPVEKLSEPIVRVLKGQDKMVLVEMEAVNRRGREFECIVTVTALVNTAGSV
jgi:two-component system CheB/CheR fusion protein